MYDDFAPKLAHVLTDYSVPIRPGDFTAIISSTANEPLVTALYEAILRRGGHPMAIPTFDHLQELYYELASDDQLDFLSPVMMAAIEKLDAFFSILAPSNTSRLASVDPKRIARSQAAKRPYIDTYYRRYSAGELRWNICPWPTDAGAQEAEMGLLAYTQFVYQACGLDQDDPVAYWTGVHRRQQRLIDWLHDKTGRQVEVCGPGVELSFSYKGRKWVNCDGRLNMPDGEIFTSPVEDSVNGFVEFSYPATRDNVWVDGIRLVYKDGYVVEMSASKNEEYLINKMGIDEGARRMGEFAIGTNRFIQQFTGNTLFDEKIGGTIHMAVGRSIPEAGGQNESTIHWDMVHDMKNGGEITVDGELFYQNGKFVVE